MTSEVTAPSLWLPEPSIVVWRRSESLAEKPVYSSALEQVPVLTTDEVRQMPSLKNVSTVQLAADGIPGNLPQVTFVQKSFWGGRCTPETEGRVGRIA